MFVRFKTRVEVLERGLFRGVSKYLKTNLWDQIYYPVYMGFGTPNKGILSKVKCLSFQTRDRFLVWSLGPVVYTGSSSTSFLYFLSSVIV